MKTLLTDSIDLASDLLKSGEIVAIPTETVYGLASNALDPYAVKKIFDTKGRPSDNPLIVHLSNFEDIYKFVLKVPNDAKILSKHFCPGPLTMIFKKNNLIPSIVSGGLDSVAIRIPSLDISRKLIDKCGFPLAAPSANLSGHPSPTSYSHVLNDLDGKIPAILKGPNCSIGVESTVIDLTSDPICLLRPGKITAEEISEVINKQVIIDKSVNNLISNLKEIKSPGVKYKHYAPNTKVILVESNKEKFCNFVNSQDNCVALGFDEDRNFIRKNFISYGNSDSQDDQLRFLFDSLRKVDNYNSDVVYVHLADRKSLNLAVLNRLLRASGFNVIKL